MDVISIIVIATFALLLLAALVVLCYWLIKLVQRVRAAGDRRSRSRSGSVSGAPSDDDDETESNSAWYRRLITKITSFRRKARRARRDLEDDADSDDELPAEVTTLLSATPLDSVIVDTDGDVLRSSPAAYNLGVVSNEAIAVPKIAEAVSAVLRNGGMCKFVIVTHTPVEYVDDGIAREVEISEDNENDLVVKDPQIGTVSRRNWLKVTVARLNATQAVILIEDVSEQKRFTRIRDAFVSNVTEQLLKPTHALERLGTELESENVDQKSLAHYAEQVRYYSGNVNHLVSDLLLLLKAQEPITATKANRIDLKPLVERVALRYQGPSEPVKVHVKVPSGLVVNGQVDQLEGAVGKLIDNAVLYSRAGSSVGVSASRSPDGSNVVLRVVDHGVGISKKDQPHIFERFWRGADQDVNPGGTGFGLAIVKHVALTHHGSVSVWSAPGQGSTFSLTLPAASTEDQTAGTPTTRNQQK